MTLQTPRKLEKLWILPEGPLRREIWRRVLRTTGLHFLLRCCAPTASESAPTEPAEAPNGQKSWISQPCENTLLTTLWSFWLSFWDLRSVLGNLECDWKLLIRILKSFIRFVCQYFKLRITHLQTHFKFPSSDLKSQNDNQNDQSVVKRVFSQGCEIQDFRAFRLSPASVGALSEAVGAQQRKRKWCEALSSFSRCQAALREQIESFTISCVLTHSFEILIYK